MVGRSARDRGQKGGAELAQGVGGGINRSQIAGQQAVHRIGDFQHLAAHFAHHVLHQVPLLFDRRSSATKS